MNNFYTAQEVAELLKIKKTTVYDLVKKQELPATKVGKQIRVSKEYLDEYLKRSRAGSEAYETGRNGMVIEDASRASVYTPDPDPVQVPDVVDSGYRAREYLRNNTGLILTGEDDFLSVFCAYYQLNEKHIPVIKQTMNGYDALYALYFGKIHAAFVTLPEERVEEICRVMLPGLSVKKVRVADMNYGLYVRQDAACLVQGIQDLADGSLRVMAGEKGSVCRMLLDELLKEAGVAKRSLNLVKKESMSHLQGLMALELDQADAVIGSEGSKEQFPDFTFIPLKKMTMILLYNEKYESFQALSDLEEVLGMTAFKRRLGLLWDCDCSRMGETI